VDVTNRLGALSPATSTGFPTLDQWFLGGLRNGNLLVLTGEPGVGKTAFALLIAYMAARSRAASLFVSATLDESELVSRLAARALYREYPESQTPYGGIWSGDAWNDEFTRGAVGTSVNVAVRKVGPLLHLYRARPFESILEIGAATAVLWERHERVVLVIDGCEAFAASAGGDATRAAVINADFANRMTQLGFELRQLASRGCAVVVTTPRECANWFNGAATFFAELTATTRTVETDLPRDRALGVRTVDLVIKKNCVGKASVLPLKFVPGAALFEERKHRGGL
jgi:archaellum biogenesis ATPase FlaH